MIEYEYLAFDPGKATGWAAWNKDLKLVNMGTCNGDKELLEFLSTVKAKKVICEDFRLFSHLAIQQSGSNMVASRAIGRIETYCHIWKAKLIMQPSNIKTVAQLWTGVKPKHNPDRHWIDAMNHGEYYMIKNGLKEIKL